ncbi:cell division control protein [Thecamonas trahens ATCC 50062]|uniref:Cell division control protein n=1 Tax=Thecamonas trahens ATCC 50062 TaxID=461836 RepID=A0A0L0DRE4_THETB|nr:cell division control protein [Thecamonas trahens ATCC 50062]KNC54860.1 cell division control protein [Thecamonas trahens ATCC 50062]|eukprot:XP_013761757.1 cell division control protein [Thecamonas trahens ATCC 50062]
MQTADRFPEAESLPVAAVVAKFAETGEDDRLSVLDFNYQALPFLPQQGGLWNRLGHVTHMFLTDTGIRTLPPALGLMTSLESLHLGQNMLTALPASLWSLTALRELILTANDLAELPTGVGNLRALTSLNVADNALQQLPAELGALSRLRLLNVSHNELAALPPQLGECSSLSVLNVGFNYLKELPLELAAAPLEYVDIQFNPLDPVLLAAVSKFGVEALMLSLNHARIHVRLGRLVPPSDDAVAEAELVERASLAVPIPTGAYHAPGSPARTPLSGTERAGEAGELDFDHVDEERKRLFSSTFTGDLSSSSVARAKARSATPTATATAAPIKMRPRAVSSADMPSVPPRVLHARARQRPAKLSSERNLGHLLRRESAWRASPAPMLNSIDVSDKSPLRTQLALGGMRRSGSSKLASGAMGESVNVSVARRPLGGHASLRLDTLLVSRLSSEVRGTKSPKAASPAESRRYYHVEEAGNGEDEPPDLPVMRRSSSMEAPVGLGASLLEGAAETTASPRGTNETADDARTAILERKAKLARNVTLARELVDTLEAYVEEPGGTRPPPAKGLFASVLGTQVSSLAAVFRTKSSEREEQASEVHVPAPGFLASPSLSVHGLSGSDDYFAQVSASFPSQLQLNYHGYHSSLHARSDTPLSDGSLSLPGGASDLELLGTESEGSSGKSTPHTSPRRVFDSHEVMTKFLEAIQSATPSAGRSSEAPSPRPAGRAGLASPLAQMQSSALSLPTQRWLAAKDKILAMRRVAASATADSSAASVVNQATASEGPAFVVVSGKSSVNSLVEALAAEALPDPEYVHDFLLMYRELLTGPELLGKLVERFNITTPSNPTPEEIEHYNKYKVVIQIRVANVVRRWIDGFWHDWCEPIMLDGLHEFFKLLVESELDAMALQLVGRVRDQLQEHDAAAEAARRVRRNLFGSSMSGPETLSRSSAGWNGAKAMVLEVEPSVAASALTRIEMEYFARIRPEEFLAPYWASAENSEEAIHAHAPNLIHYIKRFNIVAGWVATEVVMARDLRTRVALIKRFVVIAEKLLAMHNYNTLMAVLSGLNMPVVARLSRTWSRVSAKYRGPLAQLHRLMDPAGNYQTYRKKIRRIEPPLIPFIGLLVADLMFIHAANAGAESEAGLVDVEWLRSIAAVVLDIGRLQSHKPVLVVEPHVYASFKYVFVASETALVEASLAVEPEDFELEQ